MMDCWDQLLPNLYNTSETMVSARCGSESGQDGAIQIPPGFELALHVRGT